MTCEAATNHHMMTKILQSRITVTAQFIIHFFAREDGKMSTFTRLFFKHPSMSSACIVALNISLKQSLRFLCCPFQVVCYDCQSQQISAADTLLRLPRAGCHILTDEWPAETCAGVCALWRDQSS